MNKIITILSIFLMSFQAQALVGTIGEMSEGDTSHVLARVYAFGSPNKVIIHIRVESSSDESSNSNRRYFLFDLPVDDYLKIFNSEDEVSGEVGIGIGDRNKLVYEAKGSSGNRVISLIEKIYDDSHSLAQENHITIEIESSDDGKKVASIHFEAKRKAMNGSLSVVESNKNENLEVHSGVVVYDGEVFCRIKTEEQLKIAVKYLRVDICGSLLHRSMRREGASLKE